MTEKDKTTPTPSSEAVPDGEIIEVIENAIAEVGEGDDLKVYAYSVVLALRSHYNVTITRKESV